MKKKPSSVGRIPRLLKILFTVAAGTAISALLILYVLSPAWEAPSSSWLFSSTGVSCNCAGIRVFHPLYRNDGTVMCIGIKFSCRVTGVNGSDWGNQWHNIYK